MAWAFALFGMIGATACSGGDDNQPLLTMAERTEATCLSFGDDPPLEIESLPEVPCDGEHSHEMYEVLDFVKVSNAKSDTTLTDVYPGFEVLESFARRECLGAFQEFVGISSFDSEMFYSWILPTLNSWEDDKDREVLCVAANRDGSPLPEGSIEDSRR